VPVREAIENSGIQGIGSATEDVFFIEVLTMAGHIKTKHIFFSYIFEYYAPSRDCWRCTSRFYSRCCILAASSEPCSRKRVYKKI